MTGNIALDVAIGLAFVFLLYSLLATTIVELISTFFGNRARTLKTAIIRMLEDSDFKDSGKNVFTNFFEDHSHRITVALSSLFSSHHKRRYTKFYNLPSIKYLSPNRFFSKPSYLSAQNFSKAIFDLLYKDGEGQTDLERIQDALQIFKTEPNIYKDNDEVKADDEVVDNTAIEDEEKTEYFFLGETAIVKLSN